MNEVDLIIVRRSDSCVVDYQDIGYEAPDVIENYMGRRPVFQWVQSERGPWSAERRAKAWPISHEVALKTLSFLCDKEYERSGEDFSKDFTTLRERVSKFPADRFALTLVCSYNVEE